MRNNFNGLILLGLMSLLAFSCTTEEENTTPVQGEIKLSVDKFGLKVGESVMFKDLSKDVKSREWSFQSGSPTESTDSIVNVTYSNRGQFSAKLSVKFNNGTEADSTIEISVSEDVVANFTADVTSIKEGDYVTFTNGTTGGANQYEWTFAGGEPATSTEANPKVRFLTAGKHDVTLKATRSDDDATNTKAMTAFIDVAVYKLMAKFTADKGSIAPGESVKFTNNTEGDATSYEWTFEGGNPATSTETSPTVKYDAEGTFKATLIAKRADPAKADTIAMDIKVVKPVAIVNLIADMNPGFESGIAEWGTMAGTNPNESSIEETTDAKSGSKALKFNMTAKSNGVITNSSSTVDVALTSGKTYGIRFYYKITNPLSEFTIRIQPKEGWAEYKKWTSGATTNGEWKMAEAKLANMPLAEDIAALKIHIQAINGNDAAGDLIIDDLEIYEINE